MARAGAVLALCFGYHNALAHQTSAAHIDVTVGTSSVHVTLSLSVHDLAAGLGWNIAPDEAVPVSHIEQRLTKLDAYVRPRLRIWGDESECYSGPATLDLTEDPEYVALEIDFSCKSLTKALTLDYRLFLDLDPQHIAFGTMHARDRQVDLLFDAAFNRLEITL
jgi:hypothetical protein